MPMNMSQVPPQVLQALQQQQGAGAIDVGDMLQQLMQMSPDEVAATLQQMGIQVSPEQVQSAAENWVDQAADNASGSSPDDETAEPTPDSESAEGEAAPTATNNLETAEANAGEQPADDVAEGEGEGDGAQLPPNAAPTGYQGVGAGGGVDPSMAAAAMQGGGAMPRGMGAGAPAGVPGGSMDDLVSAAMMQRATGNPNAAVPMGPGVGSGGGVPMPRSANAIPSPRASGGPNNPRMSAMIADIYRSTGGKGTRKQQQPSAAIRRGAPR